MQPLEYSLILLQRKRLGLDSAKWRTVLIVTPKTLDKALKWAEEAKELDAKVKWRITDYDGKTYFSLD